ncbi:hypothetical protein [Sulfuracidifex tepidarius]|uniref:Uncharacterized protein n=1 Tax=Sulfuracidifex tepidarius TaxID=1294262 RepID=A0A510E561_9CREN|nr:hypothetical protein [Sulfuracidifex tepidarius]BBG24877.1 hypothetical protein IC006_2211 [Sulfuracidifex tepidarius]BBG27662.1 hypothetical protein IC007_2216 [Sulfuracidifex tepidarius]
MRFLKPETLSVILFAGAIEISLFEILNVSINNYDLLRYPFGLTQELPPVFWIGDFLCAFAIIIPILQYQKFDKKLYNKIVPASLVFLIFNSFFLFYFINPVFVLARDELGHSSEVFLLLARHSTLMNPGLYQAYYPFGFIYGAISFLFSPLSPTTYFIFYGPFIFPLIQLITGYAFLRLFLKSPFSELGFLVMIIASMPFYVAEWSPQLMSYNLLMPAFLLIGLIIKNGGSRLLPLLVVITGLTGLTDIGTFGSSVTALIGMIAFYRKIGNFNWKYVGYSSLLTASIYIYWVFFNPLAQGAQGGADLLLGRLVTLLESIFIPEATKNLVLPSSHLASTFIPSSPYHFYSVISKLIDGGIFLASGIASFILLLKSRKTNKFLWMAFAVGLSLIAMQSALGLANNISNVLTRMIPQAMVFFTVIIIVYLQQKKLLFKIAPFFLILLIPLAILGYAMIATSEHSPEAAFMGGELLGRYGVSSDPTYEFYVTVYCYEGHEIPTQGKISGVNFGGPYIETLSIYFNGPNLSGYDTYYNGIIENDTVFFNSGEMLAGTPTN